MACFFNACQCIEMLSWNAEILSNAIQCFSVQNQLQKISLSIGGDYYHLLHVILFWGKKGAVKKRSWLFNQKKCNTVTQQVFNVVPGIMASKVKKKRATEQFILFDPPHRKRRVFCFVGPTIYGPKTVHFFCQLLFAGREDGFPPFSAYDIIIFNEQSCTKS